jgi:hypothetical protein
MNNLLMKLQSNMVLAADIRPSVLYIYDDKLSYFSNAGVIGGQEVYLNYDQVAQVNQHRGLIESSLEIINSGGRENIRIDHITNDAAEKAKALIEERSSLVREGLSTNLPQAPLPPSGLQQNSYQDDNHSSAEVLEELANLRDQGILTEEEFEEKKRQVLDRI